MLRRFDAGAAAVLVMVLAEHLLLRRTVKKYYATHLPHYDSIGSYTFAYDVLNAYANEGWWAALRLATGFGLSLTQPLFAAVFAPLLSHDRRRACSPTTPCASGRFASHGGTGGSITLRSTCRGTNIARRHQATQIAQEHSVLTRRRPSAKA